MILRYTVSETDAGRKVYSIMRRELDISATLTRRLKLSGGIFVGGQPAYTDRLVLPGETVEINLLSAEPACDIVPETAPIQVLYEDEGLIAVNKTSGLITHPSRARYTGTLANFVAGYLQETTSDGCCHAVNRLDRDTSGIVLFAKSCYMKARASEALGAPEALKEYIALVLGSMEPASGTVDLSIRRLTEGDMRRITSPDGQNAVTHYETQATFTINGNAVSLIRLKLDTGRTHQIRVHCHAVGHPVLGDVLYYTEHSRSVSEQLGIYSQALHAQRLSFKEPLTSRFIEITAPAPDVFIRFSNEAACWQQRTCAD